MRHIITLGGGGFSTHGQASTLDDEIIRLSGRPTPRICFIPTASGDSHDYIERFYAAFPSARAHAAHLALYRLTRDRSDPRETLLSQDIIYVGGGSVANLLVLWRFHGIDRILRECWQRGIILCGVSAGMNCWFEGSITDSFGPLAPLRDGLGLLPGSACPHYDGEADRRPFFHRCLLEGSLPAGYAADDDAALHFINGSCTRVITSRPGAGGCHVEARDGRIHESPLPCVMV